MILKRNKDNYLMQVKNFVYDYKVDNSTEKIIVAVSENLSHYSVYDVINDSSSLVFTSMTDEEIESYTQDLYRNLDFILDVGRGNFE